MVKSVSRSTRITLTSRVVSRMEFEFATTVVDEASAHILVPTIGPSDKHLDYLLSRSPVFYNPRMKMNRDMAVLALRVFGRGQTEGLSICEPMSGTGVRAIRMAKEVEKTEKVIIGDLSPTAVRLASRNVELNGLSGIVRVRNLEANLLLTLHSSPGQRFDYVDLDPFGSPASFLDSAVRALKRRGLIGVTATDMAPLCGAHPQPCLRKYGGSPLHTEYCREVALRLLLGALVSASARGDRAARIVFSCSLDHYVRAYAVLEHRSVEASKAFRDMGYILHCPKCLDRRVIQDIREIGSAKCKECGGTMLIGGPMWIGLLSDPSFCKEMMREAELCGMIDKRLQQLLRLIHDESTYGPTFFRVDGVADLLNLPSAPLNQVLEGLREEGYSACRTHFHASGVKTDASISVLKRILWEQRARGLGG